MKRRRAPVRRERGGYVVSLDTEEAQLVLRLLAELRALLGDPQPDTEAQVLIVRLFPVAHPDDPEAEAEYQRFIRDDLIQSRLAAFERVEQVLAGDEHERLLDDADVTAFMQSVNSIRLVLGTMLGATDDPDAAEVTAGFEDTPEYHLYAYLSWLLEHTVQALTGE